GKGTKRYLSVFVALDAQTMKVASLLFNLAAGWDGDSTWDSFTGEMGEMKGSASFGAYEIIPRTPTGSELPYRLVPVHEFGEEKVLPIGSAFKLWVLGALAEEVAAGRVRWEERMPIYESLKSLPSGVMQEQPGGTPFPISAYARLMVSISDNTAADHLIARIGRERVEAFMSKVTDRPRLNQPLLSTRELFALKIGNDPELMEDYLAVGQEQRRRMSAPGGRLFRARPEVFSALYWTKPIAVDKLEWFASCHDLCRAMAALRELEKREGLGPVGEALRINPGIPYKREAWKSVGFKGGSEPGVMNLTFLLERADGRWFVMSTGWSSPTETLEEARLVELAAKGLDLLEKHE
ncbi:MAG: serine hydrolase, partial [Phycisphaerales bacterium]